MSGPDQGDKDKGDEDKGDETSGFLTRWSRRKQEATAPESKPEAPAPEADVPTARVTDRAVPEFDLSSLPKLEDLTGSSDITAFLRKGVPEHLRNAALRKSWALDPAIRNYVNPALEYAYDWNTPGGVPGSGEIGAGLDIARMVSQIMGSGSAVEPEVAAVNATPPADAPALSTEPSPGPEPDLPGQPVRLTDADASAAPSPADTDAGEGHETDQGASSQVASQRTDPVAPQQPLRRHGSAKPID